MTIKFDDIHTQKKQVLLDQMMRTVTDEIHKLDLASKNKKRTTCPVCNDGAIEFFAEKYGFGFDKCGRCGLLFCNPYPTDKQIQYYYNSDMKNFENDFFLESFEKRLQIFYPRIDLIKRHKSKGALLDIGSSVGIFIEALNRVEHSFDITCCDISEDACAKLKSRFPYAKVINSDFKFLKSDVQYDVVTMWDTVEHIIGLDSLFASVRKFLMQDGMFVFSTPNTKSFEWIVANTDHVQLLPPGHVNLMNVENIQILLDRHRLEIAETYTLNPSLDIDYILKSVENGNDNGNNLGTFLEQMLPDERFRASFETILKENKLAGNIVVIAKKQGR